MVHRTDERAGRRREALIAGKGSLPSDDQLIAAKKDGFSDKYLSQILEVSEDEIRNHRIELGVEEAWEGVHVSGTEDRAYYYSTYNAEDKNPVSNDKPKNHDPRWRSKPYRTGY